MTDFIKTLEQKKQLVWKEIDKYLNTIKNFPDYCQIPQKYSLLTKFHQEIISEYPKRQGKYVRPSLVLLTASAMGFPEQKAIKTASAMQVSEDWILGHDDIEDQSLERRGKPTLHRIYGKELAINAGDGLHILMWKILRDNLDIVGTKKGLAIIDEFYTMLSRTVLGQTVEIKWTKDNRVDLKDEDVLFILESKTAYYSIAGPMRLGAILADASQQQLNKIYQLGKYLGYCYQIQDDLLDLTSDFAGHKKQQGNDIYEGKRTIMLLHLLRNTKLKDKKRLILILSKPREEKTPEEVAWVIKRMKHYGSLDYGKKLMSKFENQAIDYFDKEFKFLSHSPAREQIKQFIGFITQRKY